MWLGARESWPASVLCSCPHGDCAEAVGASHNAVGRGAWDAWQGRRTGLIGDDPGGVPGRGRPVMAGVAAEWRLYGWADPGGWVPDLLAGWGMIGCGLAGWSRRPESRSGVLLAAAGFAWLAANFAAAGLGAFGWLSAHALYLHRG